MNLRTKKLTALKTYLSEKVKIPPYLKLLFKALVSGIAIYIAFSKINIEEATSVILHSNIYWLLLAFLLFNLSQWISAFRLKALLEELEIYASHWYHIRLFYFGMLYNIILPGGVGGDAYKVFLLKDRFNKKGRSIFSAIFLDRLCGLVALFFLAMILAVILDLPFEFNFNYILIGAVIIAYPAYYIFYKYLFKTFKQIYIKVNFLAILMQGTQIVCAYCILLALGADSYFLTYLMIFLLSAIATIIPITLGGLGMREIVFVYAAKFLVFDEETAIALSLIFFLITTLSSLMGIFVNMKAKPQPEVVINEA
ncbi:lysylphosphatidylglycerol synthase transmembrane domain-containing protein [Fulvivirga ligni]|uniref:lysylphosphatidylglycerol synthase transmembrane domain-containing protein n=1 Tax=Fulvivirga ligni TaxID=2904246 RepID=UPI001F16929C|nr:lysylphosphatidylglycerol synthase transmembrane domain-containing protein [Fulvivirga ligni]UII21049.1 flippase-like domain-containing protein [Fulvivirga ligni]